MNLPYLRLKGKVKGIFQSPIPYTPLLETGDSSPYFGSYEGQRIGTFDTSCCWDFSAVEVAETRLHILRDLNLIPADTMKWLQDNGYIDADGDFYISRRWVAILSGVTNNGNYQLNFWNIAAQVGLIPNSMLPYDPAQAFKYKNQNDFNNDYFNQSVITPAMKAMGLEFLKRFKIQAENVNTNGTFNSLNVIFQTYLKEGSMQIGHPVPQDGTWNRPLVDYPVGNTQAQHATEIYKFDAMQKYPFFDYDSYEPHLKQLSQNYYIPIITRVSIKPITVTVPITLPKFNLWMRMWFNLLAILQGKPVPYPTVPVGGTI